VSEARGAAVRELRVLSVDEIGAPVATAACELDAAIFPTGELARLRLGALRALRCSNVDLWKQLLHVSRSHAMGGRFAEVRTSARGPKLDDVADAPARLRERERLTGEEDLVFARPLRQFGGARLVPFRGSEAGGMP
jgi:integrase